MISPAVLAALVLTWAGGGPHCRNVEGSIATQATVEGCTSALGCFAGTLETNSPLRGSTFYVVTSVTPVPGTSELQYTGTFVVTLPNGVEATFQSTGVVDLAAGTFTETDLLVSPVEGVSGTLNISGAVAPTLTSFEGQVTGQLCQSIGSVHRAHMNDP